MSWEQFAILSLVCFWGEGRSGSSTTCSSVSAAGQCAPYKLQSTAISN